jgi:hypothetical protein
MIMANYSNDVLQTADVRSAVNQALTVVTCNMHGFSQGFSTVRDLSLSTVPDVFFASGTLANAS